jgi:hypothetical protein
MWRVALLLYRNAAVVVATHYAELGSILCLLAVLFVSLRGVIPVDPR